ncbi:hypothetical protein HMPREF3113_15510 [Stenotrophomonas sp. HMSC10F06]|nr:hypothetical protein HMPREF3113_15510 [Stenotrophomonas sp. HMSC10F06]
MDVRVRIPTEFSFRCMERVLVGFDPCEILCKPVGKFDLLFSTELTRKSDFVFSVDCSVGTLMLVSNAPEPFRIISCPFGHVPMSCLDKVFLVTMRSFTIDIVGVPACAAFLSTFDAVMEACHCCITLSLRRIKKPTRVILVGYR